MNDKYKPDGYTYKVTEQSNSRNGSDYPQARIGADALRKIGAEPGDRIRIEVNDDGESLTVRVEE